MKRSHIVIACLSIFFAFYLMYAVRKAGMQDEAISDLEGRLADMESSVDDLENSRDAYRGR